METVNVSGLKNNPTEVLRKSRQGIVVVLHRNKPDSLMIGIELADVTDAKGVKPVIATKLFQDGNLSLVRAAKLAEMVRGDFRRGQAQPCPMLQPSRVPSLEAPTPDA